MGLRRLRTLRLAVSLAFFALIGFLFLDFRGAFPPSLSGKLLYLQFVPSLLKFFHGASGNAAGFILVLILTVFFGRVYCSFFCPLGALQDAIGFFARKKRNWRGFRYSGPHNALRYFILALTALSWMAGAGFLLNLLDPFSGFGRIFSNLFRPIVLAANNLAAAALGPWGAQALYRVRYPAAAAMALGVAVLTLAAVAWLSYRRGRLYCNTVCPVGALLGLVSRISIFRIGFDLDACKGCGSCQTACKASCLDVRNRAIDSSRCVGCYNCFAACPAHGLRFETRWRGRPLALRPKPGRRDFILKLAAWFAGTTGFAGPAAKVIQSRPTTVPARPSSPVSPPGSGGIEHFVSICTACHLCVSACPSRVLAPSFLEYGFLGMMQPRMDYHLSHCAYDCAICMNVCPSGALLPMPLEKKKLTQLGVARFVKKNCVVYTDNTACGACSEHCPTKAVHMVPYPNPANKKLVIPEVKPEICIGCGGCEHACPTRPYRAIYVDGNPVHKTAQKPVAVKIDRKMDYKQDFPF